QTRGRPTLVHFWSINSEVSQANLSHVAELRDGRKREGLRVIAVHVPRSQAESDTRAVRDAIARLNLTEPCALDNEHKLRDAYLNEQGAVPAYYLFDNEGRLRSFSTGQNGLTIIEDELDQMLADLRGRHPFCPECEFFLNEEALYCADCGWSRAFVERPAPLRSHIIQTSLLFMISARQMIPRFRPSL